ncbi:MAG: sigma 54-interacting transcriptional regulator [Gemmatimonadaceae bacterium]
MSMRVFGQPIGAPASMPLIGDSTAMQELRHQISRAARTSLSVLIEGPSGSGKELVAQGLHAESGRAGRFVAFNVCAVADGMFEDAMFGHVRGAFSGAVGTNAGYCEEATGGSLFLDEIGALGLAQQSKLLRVVETKMYRKVGASVDRHSDFRLISATNVSLDQLTRALLFRHDLLHRLAGIVIRVPALDEHLEDVPHLVSHFLADLAPSGESLPKFTSDALTVLQSRKWPGNIRELKVAVERAIAFATTPRIDGQDVHAILEAAPGTIDGPPAPERRRILEALIACDWDTARAASMLNVNRSTLYRIIKRMRLRKGETLHVAGDAPYAIRASVEGSTHLRSIHRDSPSLAVNDGETEMSPAR